MQLCDVGVARWWDSGGELGDAARRFKHEGNLMIEQWNDFHSHLLGDQYKGAVGIEPMSLFVVGATTWTMKAGKSNIYRRRAVP